MSKKGGRYCCISGCYNKAGECKNISFHKFPKNKEMRDEWVRSINSQGNEGESSLWFPAEHHRICSIHFNKSGKRKYEDKVPKYFPTITSVQAGLNIIQMKRRGFKTYKRHKMSALEADPTLPQICVEDVGAVVEVQGMFSGPCYSNGSVELVPDSMANVGHSDHNYQSGRTVEEEVKRLHDMLLVVVAKNESFQQQINSLKSELACCRSKCLELDSLKMGSENLKKAVDTPGQDGGAESTPPAGCCDASGQDGAAESTPPAGSTEGPRSRRDALGKDLPESRSPEDSPPGRTVTPVFEFVSVGTIEPCVGAFCGLVRRGCSVPCSG